MFSWFKRKPVVPPPRPRKSNPGLGVQAEIDFSDGTRTWTEQVDVVRAAADVMRARGHRVTPHDTWLQHRDTGLAIQPQFASFQPLDDGGVQTVSTIEVSHPTVMPEGL